MIVKQVHRIKGRGNIVIVDELPSSVKIGGFVTCEKYEGEWRICGIEPGPVKRHRRAGLVVNGHDDDLPNEGDELTVKPKNILDETLGDVTLRQFLGVWTKDQKDRVELAGILEDLNTAIMHLELHMHHNTNDHMEAFKEMRETFNKILPKWFHR